MAESYQPLRELFSKAGYAFVEPPILHDARIFVELAGEDLRRRLFLTSDAEGHELALRPDYTIPVVKAHLEGPRAREAAAYSYLGPVFRHRQGMAGEFLQGGIEWLGRADREADVVHHVIGHSGTAGGLPGREPRGAHELRARRHGELGPHLAAFTGMGITTPGPPGPRRPTRRAPSPRRAR